MKLGEIVSPKYVCCMDPEDGEWFKMELEGWVGREVDEEVPL